MISKEIRASPIFGEFTPEEQDRYFNLSKEKVCAHVDTLYYTVSIYNDKKLELLEGVEGLINELAALKYKKNFFPSSYVDFFGMSIELKSFRNYQYCCSIDQEFDIFFTSILPNNDTPRIVVQLRSLYLVQVGAPQAICRSFRFVNNILEAFGLEVNEVKENRIDYAFHTNLVQNPYKFFKHESVAKHLKTKLIDGYDHYDTRKMDIDYVAFGNKKSNNVFVRIYNKSKEVVEMNYKALFIDKWYKDKLINAYDHYVYTRAYEMESYVTGILIGKIDWYLLHGHDENIKTELKAARESCYVKADNTDHLREKVDKYLPPVTLIMNVEFQTKRKFYHSIDHYIDMFQKAYFENGDFKGFYEKGDLPLFRIFSILNIRSEICNYLTSDSLCFVEKKGTKEERFCYWWKRINQCYIEEYDKRIIDLWRVHVYNADVEKTKRSLCRTVASLSILQNNGYSDSTFMEDVSDVLCTLNDNDFYGFAPDPSTGEIPKIEPPFYRDLKVRKERQNRSLMKEIKKLKKQN